MKNYYDIGRIERETEKAFMVDTERGGEWFPKSQCIVTYNPNGTVYTVFASSWICGRKGFYPSNKFSEADVNKFIQEMELTTEIDKQHKDEVKVENSQILEILSYNTKISEELSKKFEDVKSYCNNSIINVSTFDMLIDKFKVVRTGYNGNYADLTISYNNDSFECCI